jgi:hypothetical protein
VKFLEPVQSYMMLGGAAVIVALYFLWSNAADDRDQARADLAVAVEANAGNQVVIATLQGRIESLDAINLRLSDRQLSIARASAQERAAVDDLAEERQDVEDYLNQPIPVDLARLLFSEGRGDENRADPSGGTGGKTPKLRTLPSGRAQP